MVLALHVVLVGCSNAPAPPLQRMEVLQYLDGVLRKTEMRCPVISFGRIFAEALTTECAFEHCTIDHSRALLTDRNRTLGPVRLTVSSDFRQRKATRRQPAHEPTCTTAYRSLLLHAPLLCPHVFDHEHKRAECEQFHLRNTTSTEPAALAKTPSARATVVDKVLAYLVEPARKPSGARDGHALVRSDELLNVVERALACDMLAPVVRSQSLAGGLFGRHAIGRSITEASFWGDATRDTKARGFRGYRLKHSPNVEQLRRELSDEWPAESAAAPPPASASASASASAFASAAAPESERPLFAQLPPMPAAAGAAVSLSAEQYGMLLRNARENAQRRAEHDARQLTALDQQIADLQRQRVQAAASAASSSALLRRL
jgi:hypothetical protein